MNLLCRLAPLILLLSGSIVHAAPPERAELDQLCRKGEWEKALERTLSGLAELKQSAASPAPERLAALETATDFLFDSGHHVQNQAALAARLEQAQRTGTRIPAAHCAIAQNAVKLGDLELARQHVTIAQQQTASTDVDAILYLRRTQAMVEAAGPNPAAAEVHYKWLLDQPSGDTTEQRYLRQELVKGYAQLLIKLRRYPDSAAVLDAAIQSAAGDAKTTPQALAGYYLKHGILAFEQQKFGQAQQHAIKAMEILEAGKVRESEVRAAVLRLQGFIAARLRNYRDSERYYREAAALYTKLKGAKNSLTLEARDRWCAALASLRDYPQAEAEYRKLCDDLEDSEGTDELYAGVLTSFSAICNATQRRDEAVVWLEKALTLRRKSPDRYRVEIVDLLERLTGTLRLAGKKAEAVRYAKELEAAAAAAGNLPATTSEYVYATLSDVALDTGDKDASLRWAWKEDDVRRGNFRDMLAFGSVQQRVEFVKNQRPFDSIAACEDREALGDLLLRYKAPMFDVVMREKAAAAERQSQLTELYTRLREAEFSGAPAQEIENILISIRRAQTELTAAAGEKAPILSMLETKWKSVADALPEDTAIVEYFYFTSAESSRAQGRDCYGAAVIQRGHRPRIGFITEAKNLEDWLWSFQMRLRKGTDEEVLDRCQRLYDYIWKDCEQQFEPGVKRVIISPCALTGHISFASILRPSGRFLGEKYELRYMMSGRHVLAPRTTPERTAVIVGHPRFDESGAAEPALTTAPDEVSRVMRSVDRSVWLAPLPGTAEEITALDTLLRGWGWTSTTLTGSASTEEAVSKVTSPGILHFATHGFWLQMEQRAENLGVFRNPMYRGGLTLTGAGPTMSAWADGKMPPPSSDGVLLADEVSALPLDKTWLVTLSACDTGIGFFEGTEGQFGLTRAFLLAGAGNVLSAAWPVPDKSSATFMKEFYTALHETPDPAAALFKAQSATLLRMREASKAADAVRSVGGYMLHTTEGLR